MGQRAELDEKVVRTAIKQLELNQLTTHLNATGLTGSVFDELLGHIRRAGDLVLKRPNPEQAKRRDRFLEGLTEYVKAKAGNNLVEMLRGTIMTLNIVEKGYHEIKRARDATGAAALSPENRVAALLSRAGDICHELQQKIHSQMLGRRELPLHSFRIDIGAGASVCPDSSLAHITDVCTITLFMEAHLNNWFDENDLIVLPDMPVPGAAELNAIEEIMALAMAWRRWERLEQKCRFLGSVLEVVPDDDSPLWMPEEATTFIRCTLPDESQRLDFIANARLADRPVQTYVEMLWLTNMPAKAKGIDEQVALLPDGLVSAEEAHACEMLSEAVGYVIVDDKDTPGGLRLVEWLRGYAALQCLARKRYGDEQRAELITTISKEELTSILQRVGLEKTRAEIFIARASLRKSSWDLFDQPLIMMRNGSLLIFGPALISAYPARLTLSSLSNLRTQLSRKGKAFERSVHEFFKEHELPSHTFKTKQNGEEYEFDAIVPWDNYVFLFECKSGTLSGNNPSQAYYYALEQRSAVKQVRRLADALSSYPCVVLERTGIDIAGKTLVPCVLNLMPYAKPGKYDGIYITDMSALKRFFNERYFHLISPHQPALNARLLHRTALKSFWVGDQPLPSDLLKQLDQPFQIGLLDAHVDVTPIRFDLGEGTWVEDWELERREFSIESVAQFCGADTVWAKGEMKSVTKAIRQAKAKLDIKKQRRAKKELRQRERAWRALRK